MRHKYAILLMLIFAMVPMSEARILEKDNTRIGIWGTSYAHLKPALERFDGCFQGVSRIDFFQTPRFWGNQSLCGLYNYGTNRIWIFSTGEQIETGTIEQCLRHELGHHWNRGREDPDTVGKVHNLYDQDPLPCES